MHLSLLVTTFLPQLGYASFSLLSQQLIFATYKIITIILLYKLYSKDSIYKLLLKIAT